MSFRQVLNVIMLSLVLALSGGAGFSVSNILAEDGQTNVDSPGSILQMLEQHMGERVKLKLVSGQDLEGKLAEVGNQVVVINELTGMEFYGATVRVDQIAAVIVKTRTK